MLEQARERLPRRPVLERDRTQVIDIRPKRPTRPYRLLPILLGALVLAFWYWQTRDQAASFVVAPPLAVAEQFVTSVINGTLLRHVGTTLLEIGIGFALGVSTAFVLGYGIARNTLLDETLSPYAVAFQAIPIVAIAPVLIRFFGPGVVTNGIICALIVFFPMLMNTIVGIRSIDPTLRDLMQSYAATRWQMFLKLEIPAALPVLFGGLKVSTTLAVAAAVVGEAVSAQAGLGFLIYSSRYVYDTSGVLVGVFTLTALALALYAVMSRIERGLLAWRQREQ
ncbi:MAG: ABC transporter permease [Anaerolineae bacterium]|nr:ABC transporter permease [Anaerolineae bacterium]